jgi:hypothetical protein
MQIIQNYVQQNKIYREMRLKIDLVQGVFSIPRYPVDCIIGHVDIQGL